MSAVHWSHTALNCSDVAATADFYTRWFGFTKVRAVPVPDGEIVFLRNGSALLELFPATPPPPATGADLAGDPARSGPVQDGPHLAGAIRHIAFQTDDVASFLAGMGGAARVTLGPLAFDEVIDGWRTVWVQDPDGVVVEISQGYRDDGPEDAHLLAHQHTKEPA